MKNLLFVFTLLCATTFGIAQNTNSYDFQIETGTRFTDLSVKGLVFRDSIYGETPFLTSESMFQQYITLELNASLGTVSTIATKFSFEYGNKKKIQWKLSEETLYGRGSTLEAYVPDYSLWNTLNNDWSGGYSRIEPEKITIQNIVILDEFSFGTALPIHWGPFSMSRNIQGVYLKKSLSLPVLGTKFGTKISVEALGALLYQNWESRIASKGADYSTENGVLKGVRLAVTPLSNNKLTSKLSYSAISQTRDFRTAGEKNPSLKTFYLQVHSTANYDENISNSSSYPVLVGISPEAVTYLDKDGNKLKAFDLHPLDDRYVRSTSFPVFRAATRAGELSKVKFNRLATYQVTDNFWKEYTNNMIFRQPGEATPGRGDYYRGSIVYSFPFSGENYTIADIKKVKIKLEVKYNYAYSISVDGVHWEHVPASQISDEDGYASYTDIGSGLAVETADSFGIDDKYWFGVNPYGEGNLPPLRTSSFEKDLSDIAFADSRLIQTAHLELKIPASGLAFNFHVVENKLTYYNRPTDSSMVYYANLLGDLPKKLGSVQLSGGVVPNGYNTAFGRLANQTASASVADGELVDDNDNASLNVYRAAISDRNEGYVPGYSEGQNNLFHKISLNDRFRIYSDRGDYNGNGFEDIYENDLRPDYPMLPGSKGAALEAKLLLHPMLTADLYSRIMNVEMGDDLLKNNYSYLQLNLKKDIYFARVRGGLAEDEINDSLYYQYNDYIEDNAFEKTGLFFIDPLGNKNKKFLELNAGLNKIIEKKVENPQKRNTKLDLWTRVDLKGQSESSTVSYLGALCADALFEIPFLFKNDLQDFTLQSQLQGKVSYLTKAESGLELSYAGTIHFVKHFGPFDLTAGVGLVEARVATNPAFEKQQQGQLLLGFGGNFRGFEISMGYRYIQLLGDETGIADGFSATTKYLF